MSKVFYKLEDIEDFDNIQNFFAGQGTPTYKENAAPIDLWTEAQFEDVFEKQSGKSLFVKETSDPWGAFKNKYTQWMSRNSNFIANELSVLLEKFNPIYNYDRHEVYSGADTQLKTPDGWISTKTETPDNWKETTTQTPTNWKSTETQTPTNWKSTETQTPTNWQEQNTKAYTNYHETETQTPTNWEKTETQTPTQWQKTDTDSFTNYHETDTQRPTNWVKTTQTQGGSGANAEATENQIIPYNGTDFANTSKSTTQRQQNVTETQGGTYENDKTITGTKSHTETQTGTFQTTSGQSGTYETDKTKTGTETDTKTQSGTYKTETEQTGSFQNETQQTGTYTTETATTGTRSETTEQEGTFEDKTTYGKKLDVTGNIGVVSALDLIQQAIQLYDADFIDRWITKFIDSCCVYV